MCAQSFTVLQDLLPRSPSYEPDPPSPAQRRRCSEHDDELRRAAGSGFLGAIQLPPAAHMHLACKPQRACCLQAASPHRSAGRGRSELESRVSPSVPSECARFDGCFGAHDWLIPVPDWRQLESGWTRLVRVVRLAPMSSCHFVVLRGEMRTTGATCTAAPKRVRCKYAAAREHDRNCGGICAKAASHPEPLGQRRRPRRHQTTSRPLHSTRADETSR